VPAEYYAPGVYIEEVASGARPIQGVATSVAAFVGFAERAPDARPHLVTNWSQYAATFGGFLPDAYLAYAVRGFFDNGGRQAYVVAVGADGAADGAAAAGPASVAAAAIPARLGALGTAVAVEAAAAGAAGEGITVEVGPATGDPAPEDAFKLTVRQGGTEEVFDGLSFARGRGARNAEAVVNRESALIRLRVLAAEAERAVDRLPVAGLHALQPAQPAAPSAPARVDPTEIAGSAEGRAGILGLEAIDEITILCVPDLMSPRALGNGDALTRLKTVQTAMLDHCAAMKDRVAVLDAPPELGVQAVKEWRVAGAGFDSAYGALYYPWIKVANQTPKARRQPGEGDLIAVPPCGHVAGVWARVDSERGVHKAPANEVVRGAVDLVTQVTRNEQELLNPVGVNCIRAFPGMGIRIWGARTLASDAAWRYVNVRRLFNFVEESIDHSTQWVVFEPNDEDLWARVARDITAFLDRVWRSGALFGATAEEAFYVKCDRETNPPSVRDAGQLICEIGMAPVKPAEFVVFRFSQKALES
jgi:phage tail sheath protein FI